jgi:short-subunit dehydrogenase
MKIDGCSALITGASAGIGREFARQLAGRARCLVLMARREQRLLELRDELIACNRNLNVVAAAANASLARTCGPEPRSAAAATIHVRVVDLADKSQIDELIAWLEREKIDIDLLINNAGLGDLGPFATSDWARVDQVIQVNMTALTLLTRRLLPPMVAKKRGAILNVSSSAGFLPIAEFSVYAASKAYVTSFSESLRAELRGTGVNVCALCPGPVHTEFNQVAQRPGQRRDRSPEFAYVPVAQVVRDGIAAVEADRPLVIPGFVMKLGMLFIRLTPMSILRRFSSKQR